MSSYDVSPIMNWLQQSLPTQKGQMGNGVLVWQHVPSDTHWCKHLAQWTNKMSKCADCDTNKDLFGNKDEMAVFSFIADDKGVQCGTTSGVVYLVMNYPGYNICNERHKMYCTTSLDEVESLVQNALSTLQNRKPGEVSVVQLQPYDGTQWSMTPVDAVDPACDWIWSGASELCWAGCDPPGPARQKELCGFGNCCQGDGSPVFTPLATIDTAGTLTYAGTPAPPPPPPPPPPGPSPAPAPAPPPPGPSKGGFLAWLQAHWIWLAAVAGVAILLILAGVFTSSSRTRK